MLGGKVVFQLADGVFCRRDEINGLHRGKGLPFLFNRFDNCKPSGQIDTYFTSEFIAPVSASDDDL